MQLLLSIELPAPVTIQIRPPAREGAAPAKRTLTVLQAHLRINNDTRQIYAELPPIPNAMLLYSVEDFPEAAIDTIETHADRIRTILGDDPASVLQGLCNGKQPTLPGRVPPEISNWRAKAVLSQMGLLAHVEAALASLPEPQKTVVGFAWAGDVKLARKSPTVLALGAALKMSAGELDKFFRAAAAINI